MNKFFKKRLSIISFILIPIIFLWHPNWLGFLGLILDSVTLDSNFTQIPGLIFCGVWFGRIKPHSDFLVGHFRYGLICAFGSFLCGTLFFFQILFKNFSDINFLVVIPSVKNILAEVFLTGLFAPLICSQFLRLFKSFIGEKHDNKFLY